VRQQTGKYGRTLAHDHEVLGELIEALPRFDYFSQRCSPSLTNGLPFIWTGFDVRVRYTYRLPQLDDLDRVWRGFEEQRRRAVRKAAKTLDVVETTDLEPLLRLSGRSFERSGARIPFDEEVIRRIDAACRERGAATLLLALDASGDAQAAVYLVSDAAVAYYLLGGYGDSARTNGAMTLVLWEAIQHVAAAGAIFDFEGSVIASIERFFRSFGARQVPYLEVSKARAQARPAIGLARFAKRAVGSRSWLRRS
jgi:hypothetical protein